MKADGSKPRRRRLLVPALALALSSALLPLVRAEQSPPPQSQEEKDKAKAAEGKEQAPAGTEGEVQRLKEEITVTGTRVEGRSATDTPAPVDYIDSATLQSTGAVETGKILQLLDPSFNFSSTTISDGTDIIRPATLRSLGPDQVLVLVNGKRRHQQALLNVQQTVARGSAGYDINAIPASSIDHIEVLRDGAAAQYGSDAIAGVINIILKDSKDAADVVLDGGKTYKGDGGNGNASVNKGFKLGAEGFLSLTAEYRDRGEVNRAGVDSLRVNPPRVTQRIGEAEAKDAAFWFNAGVPAGNGRFYAFGGITDRKGNSSGFFRSAGDNRTIPSVYPNGFLPTIITEPIDTSAVVGYKGELAHDWKFDLSANYGNSKFKFREENTANVSYFFEPLNPANPTGPRFGQTPTAADTGTLEFRQTSLNADLTGKVDWGVGAGPLNVATGVEWRQDGYKITPGDPVSYQYGRTDNHNILIFGQTGEIAQPGTQGFPGWSPKEAVDKTRSNVAVYLDTESQLTKQFLAGAAVRYENYSDFGGTVTGKLSGHYDITPRFALRSTISTGFRAPSVQQEFYSQRSTNLNAAGVLTDTLTARQDSDVTRALGVPALKKETSRNYSFGFVAKPSDVFRVTADVYRIDIKDRIIFSSNIQPEDSAACGTPFNPALCPIRAVLDPLGIGQLVLFTNAVDTRTEGVDLVTVYDWRLGADSLLSFEGAFDFNHTTVTGKHSPSKILPPDVLFDKSQVTLVEEGQPRQHHTLSGTYFHGAWNTNLRFNYFGSVAGEGFTPGFKQTWGGKWLTDLAITYSFANRLSLTVGGLNIFNVYPDKWNPDKAFPFPQLGFVYGWETLPFGVSGGSYFARFTYHL